MTSLHSTMLLRGRVSPRSEITVIFLLNTASFLIGSVGGYSSRTVADTARLRIEESTPSMAMVSACSSTAACSGAQRAAKGGHTLATSG